MRDVEHLLAERGITVSYETIRRWVTHFGPMIAADLRKRRPKPHTIWHLDEVYLKIDGRLVYLWRAVDAEGEVLDVLVQTRRSRAAALKLMRKLLKKFCFVPEAVVTDDLRSFGAMTAKSVEKPFFSLTSALAKASSAALPRGPMIRSMCATLARRPLPARRSRPGRATARRDRRLTSMRQRRATAIEASRLATAKRRPLIDLDCWHPRRHTAHDIKTRAGAFTNLPLRARWFHDEWDVAG